MIDASKGADQAREQSEKKYSGHQAAEVVELMGMLAAQYDIHSASEALAIARKGAALLRDQSARIAELESRLLFYDAKCSTCGDHMGLLAECPRCRDRARVAELEAERDALKRELDEIKRQAGDANEAVHALDDLSFACFAGIGTRAPDVDTYNRTYAVLERVRPLAALSLADARDSEAQ